MIDPRPKAVIAKLDGVTLRCLYAVQDALSVRRERKVTVGRRNETSAEITSGLAAGERVVTEGAYGLEDSVKVEPAK